jgi:hypothetical protein
VTGEQQAREPALDGREPLPVLLEERRFGLL